MQTDEQEHLIQEEFQKDPEVIALRDEIPRRKSNWIMSGRCAAAQ